MRVYDEGLFGFSIVYYCLILFIRVYKGFLGFMIRVY